LARISSRELTAWYAYNIYCDEVEADAEAKRKGKGRGGTGDTPDPNDMRGLG